MTDKICSHFFNCRSLSANFEEINTCLHSVSQNFDIIALSETWFSSNDNLNMFSLPGYQFCHMDYENRRGGGVAIYAKNFIEFDVMESLSYAVDNLLECISIKLRASRKKSIIVTCIYWQPDSKIEACIDIIESFLLITNQIYIYVEICKFIKLLSSSQYQIFSGFISYVKSLSLY